MWGSDGRCRTHPPWRQGAPALRRTETGAQEESTWAEAPRMPVLVGQSGSLSGCRGPWGRGIREGGGSSPGGNSQLAMTWGSGKRLENKHALGLGGAALTAQCGRGTAAEGLGTAAEGCSQPAQPPLCRAVSEYCASRLLCDLRAPRCYSEALSGQGLRIGGMRSWRAKISQKQIVHSLSGEACNAAR